jgi:predicted CXXCH cytochrome family protein
LKNAANPSDTCKRCHKYLTDGDHHPSDPEAQPVTGKAAVLDPSFPLVSGKMDCLTCHQMHSEDIHYSGTKYFLRGGPYSDRRDICFRCHKAESYKGLNPHEQMIGKDNDLNRFTCLVCHLYAPDPKVDTFKTVKFRASVAFLCWRCHPPMIADFLDKHFLKVPSKKTFEEMLKGEAEYKVILPLDSKGRVTCSTCHNPHQPGVMVKEWAKKGEGAAKRLRDQAICSVCHTGKAL